MRKLASFLFLFFIFYHQNIYSQGKQKIENLKTFAKAYGYVKYFHPSDEAAHIDWNSFAIYGAEQIDKCSSQQEVINTLNNLFHPIAPTVIFSDTKQEFNYKNITPSNIKKYKPIYWQHNGLGIGMNNSGETYTSVRVNSRDETVKSSGFGNIMSGIDADKYIGKEIKYTGVVKIKEGSIRVQDIFGYELTTKINQWVFLII